MIGARCSPNHPGYCRAQDTFYVGNLKGVGRVYQTSSTPTPLLVPVPHKPLVLDRRRQQPFLD